MTELYISLCDQIINMDKDKLDMVSSVDCQMHDVMAEASSMDWNWDLRDVWLSRARWTQMVNQYLDPEAVSAWLALITSKMGTKGRGIATLRTNLVKTRGGGGASKETRRWGSCMLSISFKMLPHPQITLHSRTSYLGYIGVLDMTVAHTLGQYVAKALGLDVKDFKFLWINEAMQWHYFKSIGFLLHHPDAGEREWYRHNLAVPNDELTEEDWDMIQETPILKGSREWLRKLIREDELGRTYGDTTYNTYRRVRRRYHTEVIGYDYSLNFEGEYQSKRAGVGPVLMKAYVPLPHTSTATLDFATIGLPLNDDYSGEFEGEDIEEFDE